jgi:hypothetical protein
LGAGVGRRVHGFDVNGRLRNSQSAIGGAINALKLMQAVGLELEE